MEAEKNKEIDEDDEYKIMREDDKDTDNYIYFLPVFLNFLISRLKVHII